MKDSVPVVTANFSPFRLVLRSSDIWEPKLEEINSRAYDYVKLHRLSSYYDVGIAPFSLGVCFDGTLVLPAVPQFRDRSAAVAQFNKTLSELLLGGIYCEAVSPDDVGFGTISFTGYARISGGATGAAASFHIAARTEHIGTLDVIRLLNPETVTTESLQSALTTSRKLLGALEEVPREQLLYGATFYVRKQWAESLIHLWTVTERIIEIAWQRYVLTSQIPLPSKRRAFLEDHRTWSAATKLEVLFQKTLLPANIYEKLDAARKARNDLAHRGTVPSRDTVQVSLEGCFELASLCASVFADTRLFDSVIRLIVSRCNPQLFPERTKFGIDEVSHWLPLPPLPGDPEWGDREYEIIEDLVLKPIQRQEC